MVKIKNLGNQTDKNDVKHNKTKEPPKKTPPGFFSRLLYAWTFPLFYFGYRRDLEEYDLVPARTLYDSKIVGDTLERKWLEAEAKSKLTGKKPSFAKVLFKTFFWSFIPGGIMQFLYVALRTGTPLLFAELLNYWSVNSTTSKTTASYYAGAMVVANLLAAFFNHQGNMYCQQYGMKLRVATSTLMFRKIMRMNNGSLGETTAGKVVNLLSNDLQRFDLAFLFLHYVWIIPIQLVVVCYLGYMQAGYAALIGFASLLVIALPIQGFLGQVLGKVRLRTAERTDERIKVMSEVINGIQVIKMYAWEIPFQKVVGQKRMDELKEVKTATILRTVFLGFMIFTERAALFLTIMAFILFGHMMSANTIYPLQQFMSAVQINITLILPLVLSFTIELFVSLRRVQDFLEYEDRADFIDKSVTPQSQLFRNVTGSFRESKKSIRPLSYHMKPEGVITNGFNKNNSISTNGSIRRYRRSLSLSNDTAVEIRDVSASWTGDPNFLALKNISLRIRQGKLCAIIGAVGSGKSSILQLLLKELPAATGSVSVYGEMSYACQEAWLFPSTVRENILFGIPYDPEKYKRVCRVCALEKDFKQFPYSDQTLVGERGVSLSGGQRARINLARAVYREADIYLLDDPLSAVDANVGRQLFDGCINEYLRGRTRILVTHQIHFLKAADFIILLKDGSVENMGTFDELVSSGKEFAQLLSSLQEGKDQDTASIASGKVEEKEKPALLRALSTKSGADEDTRQFEAQKMAAEEKQSGNLRWEVIYSYFSAGGNIYFILFTMFLILGAAAAGSSADFWISFWTNEMAKFEEEAGTNEIDKDLNTQVGPFTTGQYLIIHGVLIIATILLVHIRVPAFVRLCIRASKKLHDRMFSTLIKGIMRFFDTSSSGRILNRFTKDMGALDEILPRTLLDVFQIYSTLIFILILNAIALYWTLIPSAILMLIFFFFVKLYLRTAQGVKRLEGVTKSPVFGTVTSSLNGIATIRAAGAQQRLITEFDNHQDLHTAAWNCYLGCGCTFGFYLDTLCQIYLTVIIFVFLYVDFDEVMQVGSVGLAVTQSNILTAMLQHGARMLVEFLAQLTSVERVLEYTRIETEVNLYEGQLALPPNWPSRGQIVFQNVTMRYAPDEDPVLKRLNISIDSGWKVGIVGRTGAGKSSLISAIFRFAFIEGEIMIDDIDTSKLAKQTLRSKISIIPQEPVLFSATIRYNLDPFDIYTDDELWCALEQVDMKSAVPSLDFKVTEGGANFSVGQRQLMCLARAVLRSNKLLIMDEATANVDPQTDNFIQQTIRKQFASCTVLTIAHRLNTIMDSDRVLVMSSGEIAEFDHPYILLSDPNSMFSSMVRETGEKSSEKLFEVAKEKYFQSNSTK
ncbi:ATP-binding cassette sub-family C member 4 [Bicyclus anynana]|uniref:ATP-binding cassette sub-family C member 4 n=1 Tax=Bicyclus anynana TaxID=110368 RepID=A0A6J1MVA9_BICAN|nr:ATP-binding cassette sub-family C member 4 [Bicyclus anynana]